MSKRKRRSKSRTRDSSAPAHAAVAEQQTNRAAPDWDDNFEPSGGREPAEAPSRPAHTDGSDAAEPPGAAWMLEPGGGSVLQTLKAILTPLASLRLTVVLFVLSIILVFAGTLAQREESVDAVQRDYFYSFVAWIEFKNLVFVNVPGGIYYPGGMVLGSALLINLLAAHAVRFRTGWKRVGIFLIHAGLVVMLVGLLVIWLFKEESNMVLSEGDTRNYVESWDQVELAVIDRSDPETDVVTAVPQAFLQSGATIEHPLLPFDVEVEQFMPNSDLVSPSADNPATAGEGLRAAAAERAVASGVDMERRDVPSAYVTLRDEETDESLGTYLFTAWIPREQTVEVDGKTYHVALRFERGYRPFTIQLLDFEHETYLGTSTPKDFTSRVRLVDPERGVDREVRIWMNHPLSYRGETFYQQSFLDERTTVLQVVRNPGWITPYVSCVLVAAGMLFHFGLHLVTFLRRSVVR